MPFELDRASSCSFCRSFFMLLARAPHVMETLVLAHELRRLPLQGAVLGDELLVFR